MLWLLLSWSILPAKGFPFYLWTKMAKKRGRPLVGRNSPSTPRGRQFQLSKRNSYRRRPQCRRMSHRLSALRRTSSDRRNDSAGNLVPLQQLENLAPGTWYVNVLASYPQWRNKGLGTALLKHAEKLAFAAGVKKGSSVIVADNNKAARRLYERMGYRPVADRPMVKENWESPGSAWIFC